MLDAILPPDVDVVEEFGEPAAAFLFPAEERAIAGAVERRRREFAAVRRCARGALAARGIPAQPIPTGSGGAPIWPPAVVGSMTHCAGYRAACVASPATVTAIGIDAEPHQPLPEQVWSMIAHPQERAALRTLPAGTHWGGVLFSAKESIYKAWYPRHRRWLGFTDVLVSIRPDGTLGLRIRPECLRPTDLSGEHYAGRWQVSRGLITTSVIVRPTHRYPGHFERQKESGCQP